MVSLGKPTIGNINWGQIINDNWTTLEGQVNAFQGRIQRDSTTQISLQRFNGDIIDVNGLSLSIGSSGISLLTSDNLISSTGADSGSTMASATLYYLYISNSAASVFAGTLRGSTTAPSSYNGIKYLGVSGNATNWRFVGYARTNASTQFVDSDSARLVINYYHRRPLRLFVCPGYSDGGSTTIWTTTSNSYTRANGGTNDTLEWISNNEDAVAIAATAVCANNGQNYNMMGIAIDSLTAVKSAATAKVPISTEIINLNTRWNDKPNEGYHIAYMVVCTTNGTATFYADGSRLGSSSDPAYTFLSGEVPG